MNSFSMKEIGSGMGTESRLERSKGEGRQDNIHLEAGNSHISNNNEGEAEGTRPLTSRTCLKKKKKKKIIRDFRK